MIIALCLSFAACATKNKTVVKDTSSIKPQSSSSSSSSSSLPDTSSDVSAGSDTGGTTPSTPSTPSVPAVPPKVYVNVTIIPGDSVPLIAQKLAAAKVCSEADSLNAVNTYPFTEASVGQVPYDPATICYRLEGYLYPDTYQFYQNMPAQDAIGKMLKNADSKIVNKGYSYQTVILASIIQKEASDVDIMKNVSSVFHNRLNDPKDYAYLGSDATTFYLTKYIQLIDTAFGSDLVNKYKYYYNTKPVNGEARRKGLPAGPICSPYANALDAAANPANTNYLNFYSDATGYHFS